MYGRMCCRGMAIVLCLVWGQHAQAQRALCPAIDTTATWVRVLADWKREDVHRGWSNDSLRRVVIAIAAADQEARRDFGRRLSESEYVDSLQRVDSTHAAVIQAIIDRFGLPTRSMVGARGADAVMLVIQHHIPLQARVLDLARAAQPGDVSPERLAMLEDRVLVHQGKAQRFGTQTTLVDARTLRFAPVADVGTLDTRRARAGLPPIVEYVCWLERDGLRVDRASIPVAAAEASGPFR